MATQFRDRVLGLVLFAIALIWTAIVYKTIPSVGGDGEYGPRAFPMFFGIVLAVSAALMIAGTFMNREITALPKMGRAVDKTEILGVAATFALIVGYGFAMERIGFVVATPILISIILFFLLGVRSVVFILIFSFGFTAGLYVVFNQFLGAYLPPGTWITLF